LVAKERGKVTLEHFSGPKLQHDETGHENGCLVDLPSFKISHLVVMLILPQSATLFWSSLEEPF
jgi:hypothetical protein